MTGEPRTHIVPLGHFTHPGGISDQLADALRPILAELQTDPCTRAFFDERIVRAAQVALKRYDNSTAVRKSRAADHTIFPDEVIR